MSRSITLDLKLNGREVQAELTDVDKLMQAIYGKSDNLFRKMGNIGNSITGMKHGLDQVKKLLDFIYTPLSDAGQLEQFEKQLTVMLGSTDAAQKRLQELIDFAASTPFQLNNVVELGNKLQSIGQYSKGLMTDLGDLSAASGKSIEQVFNAYAKLSTGQIGEAVNMFRDVLISDQDWNNALNAKGLTRTAENMQAVLHDILVEKGFSGMMDEQSKTLNGMISNLQDQLTQLSTEGGMMLLPLAKDVLNVLIPAIGGIRENLDSILPVLRVVAVSTAAYAIAMHGAAAASKIYTMAQTLANRAVKIFNTTIAANPAGIVVTAVIALTAALYELTNGFNFVTSAMHDEIEAEEESIKLKRAELDETEKLLQSQIADAKARGESAEKIKEYTTALEKAQKERKLLAKLEAELAAKKIATEYADTLHSLSDLLDGTYFTNQKIAETRLQVLADKSKSVEEKILFADHLMKSATDKQKVMLLKYKNALNNVVKTEKVVNETNEKKIQTIKQLKLEVADLKKKQEETDITDKKTLANLKSEIELRQKLIDSVTKEKKTKAIPDMPTLDVTPLSKDVDKLDTETVDKDIEAQTEAYLKLEQMKEDFFNREFERSDELMMQKEIENMNYEELNNLRVENEYVMNDVLADINNARTNDELKAYEKERQFYLKRQKLIDQQIKHKKNETKNAVNLGMQQVDAQKGFAANLANVTRNIIAQEISKAVVKQIAKVITVVPWPFNIPVAAAAGVAVKSLINAALPKFEHGEVDIKGRRHKDGGKNINIEGGESVITRLGTQRNKSILQQMNRGVKFTEAPNTTAIINHERSVAVTNNALSIDRLGRVFTTAIENQTRRLEAVEYKLNISEVDEKLTDLREKNQHMGVE